MYKAFLLNILIFSTLIAKNRHFEVNVNRINTADSVKRYNMLVVKEYHPGKFIRKFTHKDFDTTKIDIVFNGCVKYEHQEVISLRVDVLNDIEVERGLFFVKSYYDSNGVETYCRDDNKMIKANTRYKYGRIPCFLTVTQPPCMIFKNDTIFGQFISKTAVNEYIKCKRNNEIEIKVLQVNDKYHLFTKQHYQYFRYSEIKKIIGLNYHEFSNVYKDSSMSPYPKFKINFKQKQIWENENDWIWKSMEQYKANGELFIKINER